MNSDIGRNDPCPCGSGKKNKNCCNKRGALTNFKVQNKIVLGVLALVVVVAGIIAYSKITSNSSTGAQSPLTQSPSTSSSTLPSQTSSSAVPTTGLGNTPQPPGPVPAGKVWSPEHGHWHDVPGANGLSSSTPLVPNSTSPKFDILPGQEGVQAQTKITPQPPGPAPAGKTWSAEHGHWHDVPGAGQTTTTGIQPGQTTTLTPQPPGPAPAGKTWSAEHGHWHDAPADAKVIQVNPSNTDPK